MRGTAETGQQIRRLGSGVHSRMSGSLAGDVLDCCLLLGCLDVNAKNWVGMECLVEVARPREEATAQQAGIMPSPGFSGPRCQGYSVPFCGVCHPSQRNGSNCYIHIDSYPIPNPNGSAARPIQVPKFNTIQIAQDSNACRPSRNPCNALRDCHVVDWPLLVHMSRRPAF